MNDLEVKKEIFRYPDTIPDSKGTGVARLMTREIWLEECFPEWHSMLNQQIESAEFPEGSFGLWMLGGPSWAYKSAGGATFLVDNYSGSSLRSNYSYCGVCRTTGADSLAWLRINPHVIDPWKFTKLDFVFSTHHHQDHADFYTVAATLQTTDCKYVGPKNTTRLFREWGVPEERIIEVKPGDTFKCKDVTVKVERNYDNIACMTGDYKPGDPYDFDSNAVSFIFETDAGNSVIFLGDTLYNDGYKAVGSRNHIDVVITDMGHNAPGGTDKMNPWDVMRVTQNLGAKVVIADHYENWASSEIDPHQLQRIVQENDPSITACIMKSGGLYVYPRDTLSVYRLTDSSYESIAKYDIAFGHVVWIGSIFGHQTVIAGSRGGDRKQLELIDLESGNRLPLEEQVGPTQITVYEADQTVKILSANHGS